MLMLLLVFSLGEGIEGKPLDSLEVQRNQNTSFWKKLSFGIGYEGGFCYTGVDLTRDFSGSLPVSIFTNQMYWINSIKGIIVYRIADKSKINIGLGYGFSYLDDRAGLGMYIPPEDFGDSLSHGYLKTSDKWTLSFIKLLLEYQSNRFSINVSYNFCITENTEELYRGYSILIDSSNVSRWCRGFSFGLTYYFTESNFTPFIKIEGGPPLKEYRNDSPWQWEWNDKLMVSISGIYAGLIWQIGGIK